MTSDTEELHFGAWQRACEFQQSMIDKYGTTGDVGEGIRQVTAFYEALLEVERLKADAERQVELRLDELDTAGTLDRQAVIALANVYVERGVEPLQALDDAAAQVAK